MPFPAITNILSNSFSRTTLCYGLLNTLLYKLDNILCNTLSKTRFPIFFPLTQAAAEKKA